MPISLRVGPILAADGRSSVNINALVDYMRNEVQNRRFPRDFAILLSDTMAQLQIFSQTLEALLRQIVPVEGDFIELLGPNGEVVAQFGPEALVYAQGNSTNAVTAKTTILTDNIGGAITISVDGAGNQTITLTGAFGSVTLAATATAAYVNAAEYRVGGTKVLGAAPAAPAAVAGVAGGTYGAAEQAILNNLVSAFNALRTTLTTTQPILIP